MGIDPGIAATGYGVVSREGGRLYCHGAGSIKTSAKEVMGVRLRIIYDRLRELIVQYRPQAVAVEEVFVSNNRKLALSLGQAMGVAKLAAVQYGGEVHTYSALAVKQAVVGYGRAQKGQVMVMVKNLLQLELPPSSDHEADALAVAVCHLHSSGLQGILTA